MTIANKKFKCKDDHTVYTLGELGADNHFTILWTDEMGEEETDTWQKDIVEKKFKNGDWYLIDDITRPILEDRKIGKVQMDLFDQGFPNAVFEVAKVMTWAAENKGYKPHDWVNLPDAESSFPAAASRHRVKGLIQKVSGVAVSERVDEESAILHKAHEAFNVLAELELMVRGKIK